MKKGRDKLGLGRPRAKQNKKLYLSSLSLPYRYRFAAS
jgi:hypothetical protein